MWLRESGPVARPCGVAVPWARQLGTCLMALSQVRASLRCGALPAFAAPEVWQGCAVLLSSHTPGMRAQRFGIYASHDGPLLAEASGLLLPCSGQRRLMHCVTLQCGGSIHCRTVEGRCNGAHCLLCYWH
jgi:hypothetical protein